MGVSCVVENCCVSAGTARLLIIALTRFTEVMPSDYKRVLEAREEALEEGLDEDEAAARMMEVLHG